MAMEGIGGMAQQGMQKVLEGLFGGGKGSGDKGGADSAQGPGPTQMLQVLGGAGGGEGGGAGGTPGGTSVSSEASPVKYGEPF